MSIKRRQFLFLTGLISVTLAGILTKMFNSHANALELSNTNLKRECYK
ncbi:MAG: hypothetical protein F6K40_10280 [Okeania sp. SIO3I5]|nr:hypothetical protein [Okeania sp. SIO3I5]NEQ36642.1 hypothetical protein [Okeania sp. SIO3I5]